MPLALDPAERRLFFLKSDESKPVETRPVFECVVPTRRVIKQHRELYEKVQSLNAEANRKLETNDVSSYDALSADVYATVEQMVTLGVVGWRNFGKPFSGLDGLNEVLTDDELVELAYGWPRAAKLTDDDRKNSSSPRDIGAEKSVPTAVAESAPTSPTPTSESESTCPAPPAGTPTPHAPNASIVFAPAS